MTAKGNTGAIDANRKRTIRPSLTRRRSTLTMRHSSMSDLQRINASKCLRHIHGKLYTVWVLGAETVQEKHAHS